MPTPNIYQQQIWDATTFERGGRPSLYQEGPGRKLKHSGNPKELNNDGNLVFAHVDATYRMAPVSEIPASCLTKKHEIYKNVIESVPVIDMYGVTKEEHSVTTHIWTAEPYFYVSCKIPEGDTEESLCRRVKHRLQCMMLGIDPDSVNPTQREMAIAYTNDYYHLIPGELDMDDIDGELEIPEGLLRDKFKIYVMDVSIISARSIYGIHVKDGFFFKITMASPRMITAARKYFQDSAYQRFKKPIYGSAVQTFESNVAFVTRQMCDRKIRGMHWIKAKWEKDTRAKVNPLTNTIQKYPYMLNNSIKQDAQQMIRGFDIGGNDPYTYEILEKEFDIKKSESTSQIEFDVMLDDIIGIPDDPEYKNIIPPIRIWSFDIEVANSVIGMFPCATNPGDKLITACSVSYHLGQASKPFDISSFVLGGLQGDMNVDEKWGVKDEDFHVWSYKTEPEVFEGLQAHIKHIDPDIISGFNIFGFDLPYLHHRAKYLKLNPNQWGFYGRSIKDPVRIKKCTFQSNAYGRKDFDICMATGRCQLDILETIQRDYTCKFRSYTLNNVGLEILGEEKEDVPYWKITPMYMANGEQRKEMVSYCITDAYLPPKLEEKKGHVILYVEQARLYGVGVTELILRGQQHRVLTYLINFCLEEEEAGQPKLLIPKNDRIPTSDKKRDVQFEGATVVEPQKGFYTEPVATIDFKSLYPSIMLAHNLCYSTFVPPNKRKYFTEDQYFVSPSGDAFVYEHIKEGVLSKMLKRLLSARKDAKKQMANAKTPADKAMFDAKQLALKLGANSTYGFTGAGVGSLPCFAISRSVTAYGRDYINMTKAFVEQLPMLSDPKKYKMPKTTKKKKIADTTGFDKSIDYPWLIKNEKGETVYTEEYKELIKEYLDLSTDEPLEYETPYECIYGDSVTGDTPLLIKHLESGKISWRRIDSLEDDESYTRREKSTKDQVIYTTPKYAIWSDNGWTPIKRCIRHKSGKDIYRVVTHTGIVDVTEDHSLLDSNGVEISPKDIRVGTMLLHHSPLDAILEDDIVKPSFSVSEAYAMGALLADGQNEVPSDIIMAPIEYVQAFFDGFYAGDGSKKEPYTRFCQKGKETCSGLTLLAQRLGWKISVNTRVDKPDIFRITLTKKKQRTPPNKVKKIYLLRKSDTDEENGEYVYDIETENHHFHIGPGNMIVHNTDSVMIHMPYLTMKDMDESVRIGKLIEKFCNLILYPKPVEMEWEKVYGPYLLLMKKMYIGLLFMCMPARDKETGKVFDLATPLYIDAKGVMSVRRDNAKLESDLVKRVQSILMGLTCHDKICLEHLETVPPSWKPDEKPKPVYVKNPMECDVKLAEAMIKETLTDMLNGEIELDQFMITKALSRREEDYSNLQPHVKVNKDIRKRNPGEEYPLGARIPYVIANTGERTSTMNAQDPLWMAENGIEPDYDYYKKRLAKPLVKIMAPVMYQEEFKIAARRSKEIESFLAQFEDPGDTSSDEHYDGYYHMTDVFMEDDEDEEIADIYNELNKKDDKEEDDSKKKKRRVITMEDFVNFNMANNSTEEDVLKKTYSRLFMEGEKTRKRNTGMIHRAKYNLEKKRKRGGNHAPSVLDNFSITGDRTRKFEAEDEERDAFRSYSKYRRVINTVEKINPETHKYHFTHREKREKDMFKRGTEIFEQISNPKEGCARFIQHDWGLRLEEYNKKHTFAALNPQRHTEAKEQCFSNEEVMKIKRKREDKYMRSRDKHPRVAHDVNIKDLRVIKIK